MLTRSHSNTIDSTKLSDQEAKMADAESPPTIADLFKEVKSGNKKNELELENMDKTLKDNKKTIEDYIAKNDKVVKKLQTDLDEANNEVKTLKTTVTTLEGAVSSLTDEVNEVKKELKQTTKTTKKLEKSDKIRYDDKRRSNIIIEGLKEDTRVHPRQQVESLFKDIGVTIPQESVPTVTRLGPIGRKGKKQRPTLVKFTSHFHKQEIFKNVAKLKKKGKMERYLHPGRPATGGNSAQERLEISVGTGQRERTHLLCQGWVTDH